jgi:hypothetical protein
LEEIRKKSPLTKKMKMNLNRVHLIVKKVMILHQKQINLAKGILTKNKMVTSPRTLNLLIIKKQITKRTLEKEN